MIDYGSRPFKRVVVVAMVVVAIYVGFIGFKSVQMGVTCKWGWKRVSFNSLMADIPATAALQNGY